jgi:ankyrin repeat protein
MIIDDRKTRAQTKVLVVLGICGILVSGMSTILENRRRMDAAPRPADKFYAAVRAGDLAEVKNEVQLCPDFIQERDYIGKNSRETGLIYAAWWGQNEVAKYLVEQGSNIEAKEDNHSFNSLMFAVMGSNLSLVKYLIEKGAVVNATDKDGYTSLNIAVCRYGTDKMGKDGVASTSLKKKQLEIIKYLIEKGADVNQPERFFGCTPLHGAVMFHSDLVKVLIAANANVNVKNEQGMSPLAYAFSIRPNIESIKLLIEAGADVNSVDQFGSTVLDTAKLFDNKEIINLLLEHGAKK